MFSKADIEKYFLAEKSGSLFFIVIGIAAIIVAVSFLFFAKTNLYKGAAIPFIFLGVIQIAVAFTVYNSSDKLRLQNVYSYDMNPTDLKTKELPRMEKINRHFLVFKLIETVLLITGLVLFFYSRETGTMQYRTGFGLALAIAATICLSSDFIAGKRAQKYTERLSSFNPR